MSKRDILELAAILIDEHGDAALAIAKRRRDHCADKQHSDAFRLWRRIANATACLLRRRRRRGTD